MLRISKLADYAIVILSYLADKPNLILSAAKIAKETHLTSPTVSKVLKILAEASLVNAFRGVEGGYQLARKPRSIPVAEIIEAVEGPVAVTECCDIQNHCRLETSCRTKEKWQKVNQVVLLALRNVTLEDMLCEDGKQGA